MAPFKLPGFLSSDSIHTRKTSQGAPPRAEYPIQVLHNDDNAVVDIVAVHGLGSNPDYAWIWQPKNNPPGCPEYPNEHFNWLRDLLPIKLAQHRLPCRVMTFNYSSNWFMNAPQTKISNISEVLLDSLTNQRKDQGSSRLPLIFIGHSLGGNVIEQAIVSANYEWSPFTEITDLTVGVIFLGAPLRGSAVSTWGVRATSLVPSSLGSERRILKELEENSFVSKDRLKYFCNWVNAEHISVVCFFEERLTDFSSRIGGVPFKKLVVPELNACIDGSPRLPLPADHFKLNKFYGPEDPSFKRVYPAIERIICNAGGTLEHRQANWTSQSNMGPDHFQKCLQSLKVKDPGEVLFDIELRKGKRVEHTCEWILQRKEFSVWKVKNTPQLLRIVGSPGIGKTTLFTFLVEVLSREIKAYPDKALIYFFCNNNVESQRTPTAIIQSLIWQLLLQKKELIRHFKETQTKNFLSEFFIDDLSNIWGLFTEMLQDKEAGEVYILIDAFDECEQVSREPLLTHLELLFREQPTTRIKLLLTYRPGIIDIEYNLIDLGTCLKMGDNGEIDDDISRYITKNVDDLARRRNYNDNLKKDVKKALWSQAGGTFLWVSSMLGDLRYMDKDDIGAKLTELPNGLGEIYSRVLNRSISVEERQDAQFLLLSLLAAKHPLKKKEIAAAFALHRSGSVLDSKSIQDYLDICSSCSSIVDIASEDDEATVDFCHKSVKDFLLQGSSVDWFHTSLENANIHMFELCRLYMNGIGSIEGGLVNGLLRKHDARLEHYYRKYPFLEYASSMCEYHAAASSTLQKQKTDYTRQPMQLAGRDNYKDVIRQLLDTDQIDIKIQTNDGWTLLHKAAGSGQKGVAQLLLNADQIDVSSGDRGHTGSTNENGHGVAQLVNTTLGDHGGHSGLVMR